MTTGPFDLFHLLGEFWRHQLADADLLSFHNFAKLMVGEDALLRYDDLEAAAALDTVRPFLQRQWWQIELLESGLTVEPNVITYGSPGQIYGGGTLYGQTDATSFAWLLPAQIVDVGLVMDSILDPTAIWDIADFDYDPDTAVLRFDSNPFDRVDSELLYDADGTPKTYTNASGVVQQDRRLKLWLRNPQFDENTPFLRYGSIIGVSGDNSQAYVDTVKATWSMLVQGPSVDALQRGLFASAGLAYPTAGEVVEVVDSDAEGRVVITDKTVYRGAATATPLVGVGDVLSTGQAVFDTVQVVDLGDGKVDSLDALQGLAITSALANFDDVVVAPNADGNWSFLGYRDGQPEARFNLLGEATAVESFWNGVHANGVAVGASLATYINTYDPVNPMKFIIENIIGSSAVLVALRPQDFLSNDRGFLSRIETLLPAGVLILTQIALENVQDSLDLGANADTVSVLDAISAPVDVVTGGTPGAGQVGLVDYEPQVWPI